MKSAAEAVEAVEHLERDLEALNAQWFDVLDILIPFVGRDTIDTMYAAMSAHLKRVFLADARLQFTAYDAIVAGRIDRNDDPAGWLALREWVYRQPFNLDPSQPVPTREEAKKLGRITTLVRILPHFAKKSVDEVLDGLDPSWRRQNLPEFAAGMRPGIDVILASCRASGQDLTVRGQRIAQGNRHARRESSVLRHPARHRVHDPVEPLVLSFVGGAGHLGLEVVLKAHIGGRSSLSHASILRLRGLLRLDLRALRESIEPSPGLMDGPPGCVQSQRRSRSLLAGGALRRRVLVSE